MYLTRKYSFRHISCVDDALDKNHIKTVFPKLKEKGLNLPIIYQTRADLKQHELRTLIDGGVKFIQPGIESLSDEVLRLMRKGRTGLQNIQFLRCCAEMGIGISWRILYGFSGEPLSEYSRMTMLIPLLTHLTPPISCVWIALKRFSPYWASPKNFGLKEVRPWPSYSFIFPFGREELGKLAYFFDFGYADRRQPFEYSRGLRREVGRWIILWQGSVENRPRLDLFRDGKDVVIIDTRPCAVRPKQRLKGVMGQVYMYCDTVRKLDGITRHFGKFASELQICKVLGKLLADKLMVEDKGKYLSLAVMRKRTGGLEKESNETYNINQ
jgi:ribosomal peptide maturation radical SAM protein 1